jgi:AraC family transcriptional activator of pobA
MAKTSLPVYDICSIDEHAQKDLLVERFAPYLEKHYQNLHRAHRHSFYHLVLFTKGSGSHTIDFERFPVEPYQIYFMIPGQVHSWHFDEDTDGYIVHFNESLFKDFLQNPSYLPQFRFFQGSAENSVCQVSEEIISIFESLLLESKNRQLDMVRIRLMEIFIQVDRVCSYKKEAELPAQKHLLLKNFQRLIEDNFRTLKLPKEYAALLYVTPNHLNALCQDLLGKSAGDLIRDRILLEAKRMLTNLDMSISEIAYNLNFTDNSYFNRFFKKNIGITPDEFRKKFLQH